MVIFGQIDISEIQRVVEEERDLAKRHVRKTVILGKTAEEVRKAKEGPEKSDSEAGEDILDDLTDMFRDEEGQSLGLEVAVAKIKERLEGKPEIPGVKVVRVFADRVAELEDDETRDEKIRLGAMAFIGGATTRLNNPEDDFGPTDYKVVSLSLMGVLFGPTAAREFGELNKQVREQDLVMAVEWRDESPVIAVSGTETAKTFNPETFSAATSFPQIILENGPGSAD